MNDLAERHYAALSEAIARDELPLPTLPEVVREVRAVMEDEDADCRRVAEVIGTDPGLTARLLAVVNSPLYRGQGRIESVPQAVTRLGTGLVRNLVLSLVLRQLFQCSHRLTAARAENVWHHSVQVAALSRVLAQRFSRLDADLAMLAGLIHDIGALPILSYAERHPELAADGGLLDHILERLHPWTGSALLERWALDPQLVLAAGGHENLDYDHDGDADLLDVVIVANLQVHLGTDHPLGAVDWRPVPAVARLGLNPEVSVIDIPDIAEAQAATARALAV